jgi:hypothetical protein
MKVISIAGTLERRRRHELCHRDAIKIAVPNRSPSMDATTTRINQSAISMPHLDRLVPMTFPGLASPLT